jgi:hypothetical protein
VALDRQDDELVADAASLGQLHEQLHETPHEPVLIRRIPNLDDPVFIGPVVIGLS